MGSWFSTLSPFTKDPAVYATKIQDKGEAGDVQTFDYVIIGGGKWIVGL